jgi:hypothetical protein
MNTECDLEQCETCKQLTLAGNDRNGQCVTCAGDDSLTHLLRLMSAGVTRDRVTGRFTSLRKAAAVRIGVHG